MNNTDDNKLLNGVNGKGQTIEEEAEQIEKFLIETISKHFKAKRDEKGLSQRDLNKRSHVALGVIADFERKEGMPRVESLIKLAIALEFESLEIQLLLEALIPKQKPFDIIGKRDKKLLSEIISNCNYDKEEVVEIANYLKYIEYKRILKNRSKVKVSDVKTKKSK